MKHVSSLSVKGDSSRGDGRVHSTSSESPQLHLARSQIPRACVSMCVCERAHVSLWEQGPTVFAYTAVCLAWAIRVNTASSSGHRKYCSVLKWPLVSVDTAAREPPSLPSLPHKSQPRSHRSHTHAHRAVYSLPPSCVNPSAQRCDTRSNPVVEKGERMQWECVLK